jgi:FkbM family methyltransferase
MPTTVPSLASLGLRALRLLKRFSAGADLAILSLLRHLPLPTPAMARIRLAGGFTLALPPQHPRFWLYVLGAYEPEVTRLLLDSLRPGMGFVDAGAFCGYYSILAARLVGPYGTVLAVEPHPRTYRLLVQNLERNRCHNVMAISKALSDHIGLAPMVLAPGPETSHLSTTPTATGKSVMVQTSTLDHELSIRGWPPVHLVKIDVEGSEAAVLRGMTQTVLRIPCLRIVMEFDPLNLRRAGATVSDVEAAIASLGMRRISVLERSAKQVELSHLQGLRGCYNLLLERGQE